MILPTNTHPTSRTLMAYLDGELSLDERLEVSGHVVHCETCRGELDSMEADLDWFLVLEAAACPIETRPQPGGLGRLLSATRQWRNDHPEVPAECGAEKRHEGEQQAAKALEMLLGPALAAAVQRRETGGNAESLLAAFLGRRAAAALMTEVRRGGLNRLLASDVS